MVRKLQRRMTILVAVVLVLVTTGIIVSIHLMNWNHISTQAEEALETLSENSGVRPSLKRKMDEEPPEKPDSDEDETDEKGEKKEDRGREVSPGKTRPGQPIETDDTQASLSNYYVVTVSKEGEVEDWTSDRTDLYSDEQVRDLTALVLDTGKKTGRIGTQFFSLSTQNNGQRMLIVLDERLEILNAQKVLQTTILVSSLACLFLIIAAYVLIRRMVRPVQEAFDRQRQFVWDASHELKTPLAVIGANAEVLEGEIGENEYLGYIRSEVRRTNQLVQDLLTLARMDRGRENIPLEKTDLTKVAWSVALPFESTVFEEGKQFETSIADGVTCMGNESMLGQLIVILLSNALKYSDAGGTISLSLESRSHTCILRVSNTGRGIDPRDISRIFDRFYRADPAHNREVEGFGLGLSIARNIAEVHGGKIRVESELGKKTSFIVEIPA